MASNPPLDTRPFPAYLLHAPFLAISANNRLTPSRQLLQRTLPPSPLWYLHAAPRTLPGSLPPLLTLDPTRPRIQGDHSILYRATTPTGERVVLKYSTDVLSLMRETEEVYVNLPTNAVPIPTFWGMFEGKVEESQSKGLVTMLEDCGEPLPDNSFNSLSIPEKQYLLDTLTTLHSIHFSCGSFSPSSVVTQPLPPPPATTKPTDAEGGEATSTSCSSLTRRLTLVGFSKAEWHLCPGPLECRELLEAKQALGL
ncbi:uncharacterized protein JCM15063_001612 [Sporobolomyces koalae]|uniref:uncharacterized protein n=1 Tax=Sporobolomyces koalae TaxID=500713 RepID=UPI00317FA54E